jgi:hypothetical protein
MGFCLNTTNNCTPSSIIGNLQNSIFKMTGAATVIAEIVVEEYTNFGTTNLADLTDASTTF